MRSLTEPEMIQLASHNPILVRLKISQRPCKSPFDVFGSKVDIRTIIVIIYYRLRAKM